MDQDGDGSVDRGEFLQKMLVRLGKCEMSDIDEILSQCVPLRSPHSHVALLRSFCQVTSILTQVKATKLSGLNCRTQV